MSQLATIAPNLPPFTPEQMTLITNVIARGATPDELKLFLYRCQHLGLDPLKPGQIYFIKYGSGPGTIVVGIEGFRARAGKTGKLSGIKRGAVRSESGELVGAWAEVYRSDWKGCAREEVPLAEYNTGKGNWAKMPETMIKKVAEAAALRMAFPDDLGGVYTDEEMDQARDLTPVDIIPQQHVAGPIAPVVQPKAAVVIAPKSQDIPFPRMSRGQVGAAIIATAEAIRLSSDDMAAWIHELYKKPMNRMTTTEMEDFYNVLECERAGVQS